MSAVRDDGFGVSDLSGPGLLPPGTWMVDGGSTASLRFRHAVGHGVDVTSSEVAGHVEVAATSGAPTDGALWFGLGSLSCAHRRALARLRSADFLDVLRCPEIVLRICAGQPDADGHWSGSGMLTVRGLTDGVRLFAPVTPAASGDVCRLRLRARVDRRDFAITAARWRVGRSIEVLADLALRRIGH